MNHDPLCPSLQYVVLGDRVCVCYTIAKVRREMLEKCIAAVEDLFGAKDESLHWLLDGDAVLAALRALEEKP